MAAYALKFGSPIVTNDKFKTWRNGKGKNKKSKITVEEWKVIYEQRVLHKMDGNSKFTTIPPLQHRQINFVGESLTDIQAQEICSQRENEMLKRKRFDNGYQCFLRKGIAAGQEGTRWFGMSRGQRPRQISEILVSNKAVESNPRGLKANAVTVRKLFEDKGCKSAPLKIQRQTTGRL